MRIVAQLSRDRLRWEVEEVSALATISIIAHSEVEWGRWCVGDDQKPNASEDTSHKKYKTLWRRSSRGQSVAGKRSAAAAGSEG